MNQFFQLNMIFFGIYFGISSGSVIVLRFEMILGQNPIFQQLPFTPRQFTLTSQIKGDFFSEVPSTDEYENYFNKGLLIGTKILFVFCSPFLTLFLEYSFSLFSQTQQAD